MALGLVLTPYGRVPCAYPYEINKSGPDNGAFLCPRDPYYTQRGEYGFYYDTPFGGPRLSPLRGTSGTGRGLGAIPTDAEIGKHYYSWYTPVQSGWINALEPTRYIPTPWVPPDNANALWPHGPPVAFGGVGDASGDDVLRIVEEYHRKNFNLTLLSTTAAVMASLMVFFNNYKRARHEHDSLKKTL